MPFEDWPAVANAAFHNIVVLYLTMRFAKTIKQIQGLQAYHAGDKLNVEVDIVLDASTSLKDSHDLRWVVRGAPCPDNLDMHADKFVVKACNTCSSLCRSWTGPSCTSTMLATTCLHTWSSRLSEGGLCESNALPIGCSLVRYHLPA
jgi:hypothetical protein